MRESVEEKARRYLAEGRVVVELVSEDEICARCRGGGAIYKLGLEGGEWFCSCPARGRCAHLLALQLVTVASADADPEPEPSLDEERVSRAGFE